MDRGHIGDQCSVQNVELQHLEPGVLVGYLDALGFLVLDGILAKQRGGEQIAAPNRGQLFARGVKIGVGGDHVALLVQVEPENGSVLVGKPFLGPLVVAPGEVFGVDVGVGRAYPAVGGDGRVGREVVGPFHGGQGGVDRRVVDLLRGIAGRRAKTRAFTRAVGTSCQEAGCQKQQAPFKFGFSVHIPPGMLMRSFMRSRLAQC